MDKMEDLIVKIKSIFEGSGFRDTERAVDNLKKQTTGLSITPELAWKGGAELKRTLADITPTMEMEGLQKASQMTGKSFDLIKKAAAGMNLIVLDAGAEGIMTMNKFTGQIKQSGEALNELSRKAFPEFRMELLSIMFGMAMINRAVTILLRSMYTTWTKAYEDTEGYTRATDRLSAAWTYLKWSMIDALMQSPLFQSILDFVVKLVDWFGDLPEPVKEFAVWIGIAMAVITGAVGSMASLGLLLSGLAKWKASTDAITWFGSGGILWKLAGMTAIVIGISLAVESFQDFFENKFSKAFLRGLASATLIIGGIKLMKGGAGGGLLVIGISLELLATGNFFKTIMGVIAFCLASFGALNAALGWLLYSPFIVMYNFAIDVIKKLVEQINKILPSKWKIKVDFEKWKVPIPSLPDIIKTTFEKTFIPTLKLGYQLDEWAQNYMDSLDAQILASMKKTTTLPTSTILTPYEQYAATGGQPVSWNVNVSQTNNVTVSDKAEMERTFKDLQSNLVSEIKRQINVSGY